MRALGGEGECEERADAHYEVAVADDVDGARVEEFKVIEEEEDVVGIDAVVGERGEAGAEGELEVEDGGDGVGAEPGLEQRERRHGLDLEPHPGLCSVRGRRL